VLFDWNVKLPEGENYIKGSPSCHGFVLLEQCHRGMLEMQQANSCYYVNKEMKGFFDILSFDVVFIHSLASLKDCRLITREARNVNGIKIFASAAL
jgi:hypothetical protein